MDTRRHRIRTGLSAVLLLSFSVASYYGAFVPATYARDSLSMGAQGTGQDLFDLFFVAPLLLITFLFSARGAASRGQKAALFSFAGNVFYILYSFFIYAFGVHFNGLFLVYCLVLGSALYTFLFLIYELVREDVAVWFGERTPVRATAIYFLVIAALFYLLWLKDVVPALLSGTVPAGVTDNGLLVNPVHVLDLAIALPGLVATALLLFKKHPLGYIFAPVYLLFTILLSLALIAMVVVMKAKGVNDDLSVAGIFAILAVISTIFLYRFFGNLISENDGSRGGARTPEAD